ncbi:hypothetical protein GCM10023063_27020 [Arthrobacter methylotrophus]|uniref:Uncharacterized protein n=1 Tax=Arthrobacter methylotrophus TaxID=121291 RepID=A0ABV5UTB3_9MICC
MSSAAGVWAAGSPLRERQDVGRRSELEAFFGWLMGTSNESSLTSFGAARSFRRRTAWCWNIAPRIPVTGEVHDQVQVDDLWTPSDFAGSFSSPKLPVPCEGPESVHSNDGAESDIRAKTIPARPDAPGISTRFVL